MKMDDVRNVPTYLKFETTFGCTFGGLILGFIFPPFWLLTFVGIALLFARLFWEIKHPMTKEQKEQSIIERAKAKEEFRQAKEELGDSLRQARAVKCPHCKSTDVEFMVQQRKTARLEERKLTVEVETMEKDAALKDMQRELEIEKTRQELELLKNVRAFEITVDSPNVSYENVAQTQMDFDENQGEG